MAGRKIIRLKESVVLFDLYVAGEGDESLVVMSFFFFGDAKGVLFWICLDQVPKSLNQHKTPKQVESQKHLHICKLASRSQQLKPLTAGIDYLRISFIPLFSFFWRW